MASKSASSGKEKLVDEEQEVLQAVVLADSWNRRFRPLTTKKPRVGPSVVSRIDRSLSSYLSAVSSSDLQCPVAGLDV
jgi:hypothetical protein